MSRYHLHVKVAGRDEQTLTLRFDEPDDALPEARALSEAGAHVWVYTHDHYPFDSAATPAGPTYTCDGKVIWHRLAYYRPGGVEDLDGRIC